MTTSTNRLPAVGFTAPENDAAQAPTTGTQATHQLRRHSTTAELAWLATPPTDEQWVAVLALRRALESQSRLIRASHLLALPGQLVAEFLHKLTQCPPRCEVCGKPFRRGEMVRVGTCPADEGLSDASYVFAAHEGCLAHLNGASAARIWTRLEARARREFKRCYLAATGEGGGR